MWVYMLHTMRTCKKNWLISLLGNSMCRAYTRTLGERIAVFFPKFALGLLSDTGKSTFLLSISIYPYSYPYPVYFPGHSMGTVLLTLELRRSGQLNSLMCMSSLHDLHHRSWVRINSVIVLVQSQCSWFWACHIPVLKQGKQKPFLL